MAKNKRQSERTARRSAEREARKQAARTTEPKREYTLKDCMRLCRNGNILFVVFIIVSVLYYYSFQKFEMRHIYILYEIIAYGIETFAFILFTLGVVWMDRLVRARGLMKILLITYIAVEVVLMLFEFQLLPWTFYDGLSLGLIVVHAIFSAGVAFSLLMLEPHNKRVEWIVGITSTIMLTGMFLGVAGYRVYSSILVNAIAYIIFFSVMLRQLELEEVNVDCYGDQARVQNFGSTMFADTPTMVEQPDESRKLKTKVKRFAQSLSEEEKLVLTDKDEKFEYEFGVDDDDDDDDDDEWDADGSGGEDDGTA